MIKADEFYEKAKADVEALKLRQTQIAEKFAKYDRLQREIVPALHEAILRLNEAQRRVDQHNAVDLKSEREQLLTQLESNWSSTAERRVYEIFAALRTVRWVGHDWRALNVYIEGIKTPTGRLRRSWRGLMAWVHEPQKEAAA